MRGSRGFVRLAFAAQVLVGAGAGLWFAGSTPPDGTGLLVCLIAMACGVLSLGATRANGSRGVPARVAMRLNAMIVAMLVLAAGLTIAADHQLHLAARRVDVPLILAGVVGLPFVVGWVGLWRHERPAAGGTEE